MEQGVHEEKLRQIAKATGMPLPDKIKNKPELIHGLEFYWKAFTELTADRNIGMGEGPIPWTAMNQWAIRYNIRGDEFDRFISIIREVDTAYMELRNKEHKKALGRGSEKSSGKPRMRSR